MTLPLHRRHEYAIPVDFVPTELDRIILRESYRDGFSPQSYAQRFAAETLAKRGLIEWRELERAYFFKRGIGKCQGQ